MTKPAAQHEPENRNTEAAPRNTPPDARPAATVEDIAPFDPTRYRPDFPILERRVHGNPLVYLDNAATTQKPKAVLDALTGYYANYNANIHRGIHTLAEEATAAYEAARRKIARFIASPEASEIVFTRNATESINLVANAYGNRHVGPGDEILLTQMEHHSNLVPWFLLAERQGATIRHIPITQDGKLDLDALDGLLTPRTKIVSFTHMSNVLGVVNPAETIVRRVKEKTEAAVVIDAAQSVPHLAVDVAALGADFVAFSAHKMLGPTGIGVLWGRLPLLESMDPYMGGGDMIRTVELDRATWNDPPWKFEAGTPNIADVIAFGAAVDYLSEVGVERIHRHEVELVGYAMDRLEALGGVALYGPRNPRDRGGVIAFNIENVHPFDLSTILDHHGVAIRAGHHCAQPLMGILKVASTARASFYLYNEKREIDLLIDAIEDARKYFGLGGCECRKK